MKDDKPEIDYSKLTPDATLELYGGEVLLHYEDAQHVYWVVDNGGPPKGIVSTTAITKIIDKSEALIPWALWQSSKYVMDGYSDRGTTSRAQMSALLRESRDAHKMISGEAMSVGTEVHAFCEAYALAEMGRGEYPIYPTRQEALFGVEAFMEWVADRQPEWISVEQKVYSRKYGYSGTFDLLARIDGEITVVDYKTSKRLYDEYRLQVAGYAGALHEMWGHGGADYEPVTKSILVHLPKTGKRMRHFETGKLHRYNEVVTRDLDALYTVFRACLHIIGWRDAVGMFDAVQCGMREAAAEEMLVAVE